MSLQEVDQFASMFRSERELQATLVQLLAKLDGVSGVRLLQGPTERGKDIVFYHQKLRWALPGRGKRGGARDLLLSQ